MQTLIAPHHQSCDSSIPYKAVVMENCLSNKHEESGRELRQDTRCGNVG